LYRNTIGTTHPLKRSSSPWPTFLLDIFGGLRASTLTLSCHNRSYCRHESEIIRCSSYHRWLGLAYVPVITTMRSGCYLRLPGRSRGLGSLYVEHPEFLAYYNKYALGLLYFMQQAMTVYADHVLALGEVS